MLDYIYRGRVLNVAHRGASAAAPENTLAAFRAAVELGADGIELDVMLSKDRVPVIHHDFKLGRTDNGSGPVGRQTLTQLKRLDAGSWKHPSFAGERIPTLTEVFQTLDRQVVVNVELKTESFGANGLEAAVVDVIKRCHMVDMVIVSSFNPFSLMRVRDLAPQLPLGLLFAPRRRIVPVRAWLLHALRPVFGRMSRPEALHPHHELVTPRFMRWAKGRRYRVNTWTVDDPDTMRRLVKLGVDAVITNTPDVLRGVLADLKSG
jgi:glycerophosphoryl diester phosphodiesterase